MRVSDEFLRLWASNFHLTLEPFWTSLFQMAWKYSMRASEKKDKVSVTLECHSLTESVSPEIDWSNQKSRRTCTSPQALKYFFSFEPTNVILPPLFLHLIVIFDLGLGGSNALTSSLPFNVSKLSQLSLRDRAARLASLIIFNAPSMYCPAITLNKLI